MSDKEGLACSRKYEESVDA